jgi:general secretion pathway protein E
MRKHWDELRKHTACLLPWQSPVSALQSRLPLPESFEAVYLEANGIFPLEVLQGKLRVAIAGEPAIEVLDDLEISYEAPLELIPVAPEELCDAIRRTYASAESVVELVRDLDDMVGSNTESAETPFSDARDLANQPPVIKFVNLLIREAHASRASDIHLESTRDGLRSRFRIDGVLNDVPSPPRGLQAAVVSRVKLMADLDIAERRAPQDGRVRVRLEEREMDLRVSAIPTLYGESLVLRLLDRGGQPVSLGDLGMGPETLERFRALALQPHGLLLATGPTGSGKTTTLYSALALRDAAAEKVITVEDPVEYHLNGVTQMPVNRKAGVTFPTALRSILRQDPDVLMVGEMRDPETAEVATQAAMTGHLVFSTLHTNDAAGAITRLGDLHVERYIVGATLNGVLAQRLVRRLCPECQERYRPDPSAVALLAQQPVGKVLLHRGRGCSACRETGYRGRVGIFELLTLTEELRGEVARDISASRLRELASASGMQTLREDGWAKAQAGITTVEEVLRVTEH